MNIKQALKKGNEILNKRGLLDLELILSHILNVEREYIYAHHKKELTEKEYNNYMQLIKRHERGEPVDYLTNKKNFYGLDLYVDNRVLIPRHETELLVEKVIKLVSSNKIFLKNKVRILDIGTGCGNIAIALASNLKNIQIVASDISKDSLEVAKLNIKKHKLQNKIKIIKSDLLKEFKNEKFDFIVANLPYIGISEYSFVSKDVHENEPHVALYGGKDGLGLYEDLFKQVSEYGNCIYHLIGEIGFMHRKKLEKLLKNYFSGAKYKICKDLAGLDRYFVVHFKRNNN